MATIKRTAWLAQPTAVAAAAASARFGVTAEPPATIGYSTKPCAGGLDWTPHSAARDSSPIRRTAQPSVRRGPVGSERRTLVAPPGAATRTGKSRAGFVDPDDPVEHTFSERALLAADVP